MKPVLAFLQNMWVKDPARVERDIARLGEDYRRRVIEWSLFAGCLTGRRLKAAFPPWILAKIAWEESTRQIAGDSKTIFPPDPGHITAALAAYRPLVVITFGKIAGDAVQALWAGPLIRVPHPAARQLDTFARLQAASRELRASLIRASEEPARVWKQEYLWQPWPPVNASLSPAPENVHGTPKSVSNP